MLMRLSRKLIKRYEKLQTVGCVIAIGGIATLAGALNIRDVTGQYTLAFYLSAAVVTCAVMFVTYCGKRIDDEKEMLELKRARNEKCASELGTQKSA